MATYDINLNATVKQNITNLIKQNQPALVNLKANMIDLSGLADVTGTGFDYTNSDGKLVTPNTKVTAIGVEYYGGTGTKTFYYWRDDLAKFRNYPSLIGNTTAPVKVAFIGETIGKLLGTHSTITALDICQFLGIHPVVANAITRNVSTTYTSFAFNTGTPNWSNINYNDLEVTGGRLLYIMGSAFTVYVGD